MNRSVPMHVLLGFFLLGVMPLSGQDLMDFLEEEQDETIEYATNTFFSTRVINGQSIENPYPGDLIFVISHHFGSLNQGIYDFWGLDQATIRLGLEYGVNDRLAVAVGRSSYEKTYDAFLKYKLIRQKTGSRSSLLSASAFSGISIKSLRWFPGDEDRVFGDRISYVNQLLIARRFSRSLSIQLSPAWVHVNSPVSPDDPNDYLILGVGGRLRISDWVALNVEYFHRFQQPLSFETYNSFSVGFDLDTGGHVFQLHFTNSMPMFEKGFLTETRGNWLDGDIHFGFHITRVFTLR
jgi:hypothetical protein